MLWHPPGEEPPARLCDALARREIRISRCADPFRAMTEVCQLARSPRVSALILLLIEPRRLRRPADVVEAVESYVPHATCWTFDADAHPELREIGEAELETWRRLESERRATRGRPSGSDGGSAGTATAAGTGTPMHPQAGSPRPEPPADEPGDRGGEAGDSGDEDEGVEGPRLKLVSHGDDEPGGADVAGPGLADAAGGGQDRQGAGEDPPGSGALGPAGTPIHPPTDSLEAPRTGPARSGDDRGERDAGAEDGDPPPVLSDEELRMLLGDERDPGEPGGDPGGGSRGPGRE